MRLAVATRWSSRIDAIKPLRFNLLNIKKVLMEISASDAFDKSTKFTANTMIGYIDFKFVCSVCIWFKILEKINIVSIALQKISMNMESAIVMLESVQTFISNCKANEFDEIIKTAEQIATELSIEKNFTERAGRKRTADNQEVSPKDNFKQVFFDFICFRRYSKLNQRAFRLISETKWIIFVFIWFWIH